MNNILSAKENVHSSLQDTLTTLEESPEYLVNARTRPDLSQASDRSVSNRFPWQSGSMAGGELCHGNRFIQLPMEYEKPRANVGGQTGGLDVGTRENKLVKTRTPSQVKNKTFMQHARSFSSPVQMMDQNPPPNKNGMSQSNQVGRPKSAPAQRALSRIPYRNEAHFNRLMSRIPSNRPARPHSVAIAERPSSRQSDAMTRRSPFLWDNPLSRGIQTETVVQRR